MSKFSILTTLLATTLIFQACSKDKSSEKTTKIPTQKSVHKANSILSTNEFVLTDLEDKQYTIEKTAGGFELKDNKDKLLLLDVFATWCPPCQAEATHLTSLQRQFKRNLRVIGITVEAGIDNDKLENFRRRHNAHYALVNSSENARIINEIANKLNIGNDFGIPLMALYKNGKLINFYQGATEEEFIRSDIKKALGK